ncbi:MAG: hypothetical protein GX958_00910 [Desulfitobacterium sp.]|nr:hypothetical protein [Desulfitobacterium sp.]
MRNYKLYGLVGGTTFAVVQTGLNYYFTKEFSFIGLAGGLAWFLSALVLERLFKPKK